MNSGAHPIDDRQFMAMLSLLDDEDPEVASHVWGQLSAMGALGVERLEAACEAQEDPAMLVRLAEAIQRLQLQTLKKELRQWRMEGGKDLMMGWYLVSKYQFPELDFAKCRNEVNRLINKTWLELNDRMSVDQKLKVVNHMLFLMEGYGPNSTKPHHPSNSYLNYLLEQQEGNPISLSLLYLIIGKQLGLPLFGVILPGYFILMYKDEYHEFFIDVYNGGKTFSRSRLESYLKEIKVEERPAYFKPTSNIYMILSLLETLATDYDRAGRDGKTAAILELLSGIEVKLDDE